MAYSNSKESTVKTFNARVAANLRAVSFSRFCDRRSIEFRRLNAGPQRDRRGFYDDLKIFRGDAGASERTNGSSYRVHVIVVKSNLRPLISKVRIGSFDGVVNGAVPERVDYNGPRNEALSFLNNYSATSQVARALRGLLLSAH